jgi:TatA/E family protein of Tat protein translocase
VPGIPFVGQWEMIALAVVFMLVFGPKQIPRIARQLGGGIREVREVASMDLDAEPKRRAPEPARASEPTHRDPEPTRSEPEQR